MIEYDESTGLPKLPDKWFWRIRLEHNLFTELGIVNVEIRVKRWYGSACLYSSRWAPHGGDDITGTVKILATNTLWDYLAIHQGELDLARILGDYPPKKLEANDDRL
jgi:hypothetical protein